MAPQFSFITVFHRIYCHLRNIMSDLPPSPEKSWLDGFQTTPDTYLPFNIDRLTDDYIHRGWLASDLQISLLEFFKHREGIKHEFLITTLTNSATRKMAGYILAERQGVRPAHAENDPASSTHSFSSISKSSSVSSTAAKEWVFWAGSHRNSFKNPGHCKPTMGHIQDQEGRDTVKMGSLGGLGT
ncbi:hypothetical protein BKA93DRAFT_328574 [Sparassis latifolia]